MEKKHRLEQYFGSSISRAWLTESRDKMKGPMVPIAERENTVEAGSEKLYTKVMSC